MSSHEAGTVSSADLSTLPTYAEAEARSIYRPTLPLSGEFWLVCTSRFGPTRGTLQIPPPDRRNRPISPRFRP